VLELDNCGRTTKNAYCHIYSLWEFLSDSEFNQTKKVLIEEGKENDEAEEGTQDSTSRLIALSPHTTDW
jgi:hypothetical protein